MLPSYDWLDQHNARCDDGICQGGWRTIIDRLAARLDGTLRGSTVKLRLLQIKEKVGSLRVYYRLDGATPQQAEAVQAYVQEACDASLAICMLCGERGALINLDGLFVTACKTHAATIEQERKC